LNPAKGQEGEEMNAALRALLTGLIDYAGLFPPAKLPMDQAVRNYLRYRDEPEGWMLGRFICPAARLGELAAFEKEIGRRALAVSALGRGGDDLGRFMDNLAADLADVAACRQRHGERVTIDVLELKLPASEIAEDVRKYFLRTMAQHTVPAEVTTFVEPPAGDLPLAGALIQSLKRDFGGPDVGFKMRAGGLEASAFPRCEQVAHLVGSCAANGVRFKATAGLHHPLPRFDEQIGARMHGFVNLFAAGVLTADPVEITKILKDEGPSHFRFDDDGLSWGALSAPLDTIRRARMTTMTSFGSCSFDEPRDDLRALGWL
jgi:hypothetical protein